MVYTLLKRGTYHPDFCQDFLVQLDLTPELHFAAVMDGCSMGINSHFASALFGKILKKAATRWQYENFQSSVLKTNSSDVGINILKYFWTDLIQIKGQLLLNWDELLSTLIVLIFNKKTQNVYIVAAGDGIIAINNEIINLDHQNHPNYLAFHLDKSFENWLEGETYSAFKSQIINAAIATDGIETFIKNDDRKEKLNFDPISFLLIDQQKMESTEMLEWKFHQLKKEEVIPFDDLGIVRIIC